MPTPNPPFDTPNCYEFAHITLTLILFQKQQGLNEFCSNFKQITVTHVAEVSKLLL